MSSSAGELDEPAQSRQHQPDDGGVMGSGGFSDDGLARMHEVLAEYVERAEIPGLVTLVSRGDEVHVDAIGTMAFGDTRPIERDTIFRISSMTKPVTAAATMLLDDGTLQLDEP